MGKFIGTFVLGETVPFSVQCHDPDPAGDGDEIDADGNPTFAIRGGTTDAAIDSGSMSKFDDSNTVGYYKGSQTLDGDYATGGTYRIRKRVQIGGAYYVEEDVFQVVADPQLDGNNRILAALDEVTIDGETALQGSGLALEASVASVAGLAEAAATSAAEAANRLPSSLGADGSIKATLMGVKEQAWNGDAEKPYDVAT